MDKKEQIKEILNKYSEEVTVTDTGFKFSIIPSGKFDVIASDLDTLINQVKIETIAKCDEAVLDIETPTIAIMKYQKKCFTAFNKMIKAIKEK